MFTSPSTTCNAPSAFIQSYSLQSRLSLSPTTPNGCSTTHGMNFAISTRGRAPGVDHLGIQVENKDELHEVYGQLRRAGGNIVEQGQTNCCYAKSEKSWIDDPAGISWETF